MSGGVGTVGSPVGAKRSDPARDPPSFRRYIVPVPIGFRDPCIGPFASLLFPCNPAIFSLLFALGRSSTNSLRHNDFQQQIGPVLPAFSCKSSCYRNVQS